MNNNTNNNDYMQLSSSKSSGSSSASKSNSTSRRSRSSGRRHRSKSRSHSRSSHSPHHHRRSHHHRSRSPSERRHHHHSSSSSSSSSRRRHHHHHSRSRSRDFSRSHSRDRSASPVRPALSVPDPLALTYKPIPNNQLKLLAEGKYISMHKLIRPYLSSSNTEHEQVELNGTGIFVSHTPKPKTRSINTPLDWFEVFLSSILPALAQRVLQSTTHEDALALANTLQQHICYALHAVSFFRQYPNNFTIVFKYLEAHRESCTNASPQSNVAMPNTHLKQDMHHGIVASLSNSNSNQQRSSTSNSHSSSGSKKSSTLKKSNTSKTYTHNDCGDFNSFKGCARGTACAYAHTCRHCKSADHGKTSCAAFKSTQNTNNTNTNNKNMKK